MKRMLLTPLLFLDLLLSPLCGATTPDSALLLRLPLDEGVGTLAADRSANQLEAELTNVQWAKGAFGTAARFGGTNAFIDLPPIPALNGATQFTLSVWATWEGTGRYPNLLTTHTWSPGGLMLFVHDNSCSFRMGRPGHRAGASGNGWTETSASLLNALPLRQWTHLCVVFAMPDIATYVNGKAVAKRKWSYPVQADGLRIGCWAGPVCHNGLISDVRIYGRALAAPEVDALAHDPARASAGYTLVDESKAAPPPAATFENRRATLAIDARGRITSLRCKASRRELLVRPQELVSARLKDGRQIIARKASFKGGALTFEFSRGQGAAVLAVDTRKDHFTFTIRSLTVPDVAALTFFNVPVAAATHRGGMANMLSDDDDAVCLRGYDLPVEMAVSGNPAGLRVWTTAEHGPTGWRAGLAAGPKKEMPAILRAMAVDAGVPVSKLGGPWSLGAEANRGSYLFADLSLASVDEWIELARRGGFTHIHIHGWWSTLGHYGVNTNHFPNGLADMKATVARIHAAGLKAGIHTLTACIDPRDAWVTPEASPHLIAAASYTLAQPMSPTNTVIYVNEKPSAHHDVVFTYTGNGNAIRIGTEIVQYSEVHSEPPYAFAKCQRGAFKTRPSAHAAGDRADYLQQRYIAFYPEPGSPLADELAEHIATVFNTCQLDQIYFDGSEGMMSRYGIDYMRHAIFKRLRGEVLVEASEWGTHNWWFHSRLGSWDQSDW
ncbi:MAG: LamG-like jellyroll fold domain-containing protein, partial [Verrucomicrobiia bacterium]